MRSDCLGNEVGVGSEAIRAAIDDFVAGFLAYETRAERIVQAAAAEPDCTLANAYAGMVWMFLEAPGAADHAGPYLRAAEAGSRHATRRELLNVTLLRAWVDDDLATTLKLCDQITDEFPRDLVVLKLQQYLEFNRGNAPAMLRAASKVAAQNADVPYMHGMAAFALEQCHLLDEAEAEAQVALSMRRKEPWAQHALAHVYLTRGGIDAGTVFLEGLQDTWTGLNSFMLTHLWWHLALFYISQGRADEALRAYDDHCWGVAKNYSQDQVGAVSLLSRLELAGIDVGERWRDLGEHLRARVADTVQPFLTLQYVYGLARAGLPEGAQLLERVRAFAASAPAFSRAVWQEVVLPGCMGLYAHAHGDAESAWHELSAAVPRMLEAGGSHAQRDLFEQVLLDAAIKTGRLTTAQQVLELRRVTDPDGVPLNRALAAVYLDLGLTALAGQARARAGATVARHTRRRDRAAVAPS